MSPQKEKIENFKTNRKTKIKTQKISKNKN